MRKSALILAALALAACNTREEEFHGEVVDTTIDNSKASLEILRDTVNMPGIVADSDTVVLKKPFGRKPVDMKDSLRRP